MKPEIRKALAAPFPPDAVKHRRGAFGREISYVEGGAIVARLNDAFDGDWSFAIAEHRTLPTGEVLVHGKLTALGVVKEAFGKSAPAIARDTGEVISEADAYKAAATDSLKKCAIMLGVALYLYTDDPTEPEDKPSHGPQPSQGSQGSQAASAPTPAKTGAARASLTQKQLAAIWNLGRRLGLGVDAVRQRAVERFGVAPEQLSRTDASTLISALGREIGGRSAA